MLTREELCKGLGISPGMVSRLSKRGMPTDDIEAAKHWRAANSKRGIGHQANSDSATASAKQMVDALQRPGGAFETAPEDPAGTLARMRETEQRVYKLIDAALEKAKKSQDANDYAAIPGLLRSYNQAGANALAAASAWERHCRSSGLVAPVEYLMTVLQTRLEPLAAQMDNLPRSVAALANPQQPDVAEKAIGSALVSLRRQIAAALEPVPAAPEAA